MKITGIKLFLASIGTMLMLTSCEKNYEETTVKNYLNKVNAWHTKRVANLKKESGWLNLVGLHWLKEGENSFGSDTSNDIVFPSNKSEKIIGHIIKNDSIITTVINDGVSVKHNSENVQKIIMKADISGNPTILSHKSLKWFIIKRDDKYGIRLRDLEADLLVNFEGIERFQVQDEWNIKAKFQKYDPPKKIMIPTILGTINEGLSPGKLVFSVDNNEYTLEPTGSLEKLFIVFADLTSGEETYGAGRFLSIDGPDSNNNVNLDFNKAYNPPCAFTKYATCPLPPDENKLKVKITAGEKKYSKGH